MRAAPALRAVVVASVGAWVLWGAAGCSLDLAPRPNLVSRLRFDCGTVQANLSVTCKDGDPVQIRSATAGNEPVVVPEGPDGVGDQISMECVDLAQTPDPGRIAAAAYHASCESVASENGLTRRLILEGRAERRCDTGERGSAGDAKPIWRGAIATPAGGDFCLQISAEATKAACDLRIADGPPIPISSGRHPLRTCSVPAGSHTTLTLDCFGQHYLAAAECFGYVPGGLNSPAVMSERVLLTVKVSPSGETICPSACSGGGG